MLYDMCFQARAQDALNFVLEYLPKADRGYQSTLLREATLLCSSYPVLFSLFTDKVLAGVRKHQTRLDTHFPLTAIYNFLTVHASFDSTNQLNQVISVSQAQNQVTSGGVTIVKVGAPSQPVPTLQGGYTRRAKLGDSRSTGRLHTATNTNTHRSMTRLNIAGA